MFLNWDVCLFDGSAKEVFVFSFFNFEDTESYVGDTFNSSMLAPFNNHHAEPPSLAGGVVNDADTNYSDDEGMLQGMFNSRNLSGMDTGDFESTQNNRNEIPNSWDPSSPMAENDDEVLNEYKLKEKTF